MAQAAARQAKETRMQTYLEPTQESGRAFFMRGMTGSVVMLNLLRYRAMASPSRRSGHVRTQYRGSNKLETISARRCSMLRLFHCS